MSTEENSLVILGVIKGLLTQVRYNSIRLVQSYCGSWSSGAFGMLTTSPCQTSSDPKLQQVRMFVFLIAEYTDYGPLSNFCRRGYHLVIGLYIPW